MTDDVFPSYTEAEVKADAIVHAIGVTAGCIAAITLVVIALEQLPTTAATAVVIYALGMLAMFCFSAAYNLSRGPKRWLLRRCDHAAIFIKIAATYTPFAAAKMGGNIGLVLLVTVWGIALAGAAAKLIVPQRFARMLLRAVPGARVDVHLHHAAAARRAVADGDDAAARRRRALYGGRRVPLFGAAAVPQRHLARLRAGGLRLPLRGGARRGGVGLGGNSLSPAGRGCRTRPFVGCS